MNHKRYCLSITFDWISHRYLCIVYFNFCVTFKWTKYYRNDQQNEYENYQSTELLVLITRTVLSVLGKCYPFLVFQLCTGVPCDADSKCWRLFIFPLLFDYENSIERKRHHLKYIEWFEQIIYFICKLLYSKKKSDAWFTWMIYSLSWIQIISYCKVIYKVQNCVQCLNWFKTDPKSMWPNLMEGLYAIGQLPPSWIGEWWCFLTWNWTSSAWICFSIFSKNIHLQTNDKNESLA